VTTRAVEPLSENEREIALAVAEREGGETRKWLNLVLEAYDGREAEVERLREELTQAEVKALLNLGKAQDAEFRLVRLREERDRLRLALEFPPSAEGERVMDRDHVAELLSLREERGALHRQLRVAKASRDRLVDAVAAAVGDAEGQEAYHGNKMLELTKGQVQLLGKALEALPAREGG
jgi:hypothetical protein